jgi:beta-glucanase (GH16 family)
MSSTAVSTLMGLSLAFTVEAVGAEAKPEPADSLPPVAAGRVWKLIWHDEFDGEKVDESRWVIPERQCRDAWWTPKAIEPDGKGHLRVRIFKEGDRYYDGGMHTNGKFARVFGCYVARMRLQKQAGHWSAFWLWNNGMKGASGRFEIDIMERPWLDDRIQHTFHWGPTGPGHKSSGEVAHVPDVAEGWHTFTLLWTPEEYAFYVDGKETWRPRGVPIWREPLYLLLTDEIEFKGWAGDVRNATLPDEFLVDYVRVYDLVDTETGKAVWPVPTVAVPTLK